MRFYLGEISRCTTNILLLRFHPLAHTDCVPSSKPGRNRSSKHTAAILSKYALHSTSTTWHLKQTKDKIRPKHRYKSIFTKGKMKYNLHMVSDKKHFPHSKPRLILHHQKVTKDGGYWCGFAIGTFSTQ